jgi:hypothetical protein
MPSWDDLMSLPPQSQAQTCDLRWEARFTPAFAAVRVWTSRCDTLDGEPFDHTVYVEVLEYIPGNPAWYDLGHYDGDNPPESLAYGPRDLGLEEGQDTNTEWSAQPGARLCLTPPGQKPWWDKD